MCYLLLHGELPNGKQKTEFDGTVTHHTMVHEQLARLYQGFRRDAHPIAVIAGVVRAPSCSRGGAPASSRRTSSSGP